MSRTTYDDMPDARIAPVATSSRWMPLPGDTTTERPSGENAIAPPPPSRYS
jgi:hypothetical protein